MQLHAYIRDARRSVFRNAKQFWKESKAPFSYEYYSNIERGTKLPNPEALLFIVEALELNRKKACFLWAMESMPNEETRNFFKWDDEVIEKSVPIGPQIRLENTFLVSSKHKKLLESSPVFWEVLSFFAMHEGESFSLQQLVDYIDMEKTELLKVLGDLVEHALLLYRNRRYSHPKAYMHIPNNKDFHKLRNINFVHTAKQLLHTLRPEMIELGTAIRTTINKRVTYDDMRRVQKHLDFVIGDMVNLPSPTGQEDGVNYTLCIAYGPRDFTRRLRKRGK